MTKVFNPIPALVLYHGGGCQDGYMACYVAHLALAHTREHVVYQAVSYGDPIPDLAGRDVFILDFSYQPEALILAAKTAHSVVLLDHHKTAFADWRAHFPLAGQDLDDEDLQEKISLDLGNLTVRFSLRQSGAGLAWDHFADDLIGNPMLYASQMRKTRLLIDAVQDRDLWRFELDTTERLCAALSTVPQTFAAYTEFIHFTSVDSMLKLGEGVVRHNAQLVSAIALRSIQVRFEDHTALLVNCSKEHASIVGHALCQFWPFSITYEVIGKDAVVSLRSKAGGFDVSALAKKHGGGGHHSAAGFKLPVAEFFALFAV